MSQSYTNYFTYATSRPTPLQIAFWSGKYRGHPVGKHDECRVGGRPLGQSETSPCRDARSERPLCQRLQHRDLTGTDAQIVRSYTATSNL